MKMKSLIVSIVIATVVGGAGYGLYWFGMSRGMQMAGGTVPQTGKQVLYWHDPMVPGQKFDKPGKSPFMDMQLVPVYEDGGSSAGGVTIDPRRLRPWSKR